jgi:hypothetical protein
MRPTYRTSFAPESDRRNHTMYSDTNVRDWYLRIAERPAVQKGYQVPKFVTDVPMP